MSAQVNDVKWKDVNIDKMKRWLDMANCIDWSDCMIWARQIGLVRLTGLPAQPILMWNLKSADPLLSYG